MATKSLLYCISEAERRKLAAQPLLYQGLAPSNDRMGSDYASPAVMGPI